jgi:hypothetical protein
MSSPSAGAQKLAAVVVTLSHKTQYTADEEIAFRHVRHFLGRYDKYVLIPDSHAAIYPGFIPKRFPARFFSSPQAHGSLLLSEQFYRAFLDYDFILVCHLDALVLSDQLAEWCRAGYDYIGAPWMPSPDTPHVNEPSVGGGGFSLRRVRSFLRVLSSRRYFVDPEDYWSQYAARTSPIVRFLNTPRRYLKRLPCFNDVRWHVRCALRGDMREDRFWAKHATRYDPSFRIAPVEDAMRFAFEAEPRTCHERIGRRLPFGCHRWQRFDRGFYEPYLLRHGPGSDVRIRPAREAREEWDGEWSAVALLATRPLKVGIQP